MSHATDYPMSVPQDFSQLEVFHRRTDEGLKEVQQTPDKLLVPHDSGDALKEVQQTPDKLLAVPFRDSKEVAFDDSKEVHNSTRTSLISHLWGKSFDKSPTSAQSYLGSSTTLLPEDKPRRRRICWLPAKIFWILLAATLIVIALAVGIPVGLLMSKNKSGISSANGSNLAAAPKPASAPAPPPPAAPANLNNDSSGIASVAWNDTHGVTQYRFYFQDSQQTIRESAWNSSAQKWMETQSIGVAKGKSPITAAITGPQDFPFELSVYAVAENGSIVEWTTTDSTTFRTGNMTSQKIIPSNESSLSALWDRHHGCPQCSDSLLFSYLRSDGQIEVGNYTQSGWNWATLQSSPAPYTDLSLSLRWQNDSAGDIRLFYQIKDGHLVSQDYNSPRSSPSFTWISRESNPIAQLNSISPLSSFTYGDQPTGDALENDIISANSTGLTVNWWSGIYNVNIPSANPSALLSVDATALASNGDAHVYALLRNGTIAEFQMLNDEYHWAYVGNVNTG